MVQSDLSARWRPLDGTEMNLDQIAKLARDYAAICDDREQREYWQAIIAEVVSFTSLEAIFFAQQVASWTEPTGNAICTRLTVLGNRVKEASSSFAGGDSYDYY